MPYYAELDQMLGNNAPMVPQIPYTGFVSSCTISHNITVFAYITTKFCECVCINSQSFVPSVSASNSSFQLFYVAVVSSHEFGFTTWRVCWRPYHLLGVLRRSRLWLAALNTPWSFFHSRFLSLFPSSLLIRVTVQPRLGLLFNLQ